MRPVDLSAISRFNVEASILARAEELLCRQGDLGREALVLLAGTPADNSTLRIDTLFFPEQRATSTSVALTDRSLIDVHAELFRLDRLIALQIHTHPGRAFHSDVDEADETVTQAGSVSIVVPNFARRGLVEWPGCVGFRRTHDGWSAALARAELGRLVGILR